MSLWQLKKLSTNEALNSPQPLPENWGPIFGLNGVVERIGDLSWLGPEYVDQGWIKVSDGYLPGPPGEQMVWNTAKVLLEESDWSMMSDVPMTSAKKVEWIEYRKALREIKLQPGFPNEIVWPTKPS